jgi:hypothetical protein
MPDPNNPTDPMDKAYAQAEAMLGDERARTARRARILAAVASEPAAPISPVLASRRSAFGRGGWLVAAGVAGLGVIIATEVYLPTVRPKPEAPAPLAPAGSAAPSVRMEPVPPIVQAPLPPAAKVAPKSVQSAKPDVEVETARLRASPPAAFTRPQQPAPAADALAASPAPAMAPAPPPRPVAPVERRSTTPEPPRDLPRLNEIVVTAQRREKGLQDAPVSQALPARRAAPDQAEKLRAAAAAGRTSELKSLLVKGVPVDAADEDGETALMKSVKAHQPEAAALLRRRGADLDRANDAGVSVRDMATSIDDAELNEALGIGP